MMARVGKAAVPAFLFLCLLAGGSSQGRLSNAALQLLAILLVAWSAWSPGKTSVNRPARLLLILAVCAVALVVLQLVPLPPQLWSALPGRAPVREGYALMGIEPPWLPLSLSPHDTLATGYTLLPPLGVLAAMLAIRSYRESWIGAAIVAGAVASVLLGAVQVGSGGRSEWAYLYPIRSPGAVGFFANRNHMATLLLAALPFAAALFATSTPTAERRGKAFAMVALGIGGFGLAVAGLVINSSLAALALALPVTAFSLLILPAGWRSRRLLVPLAAVGIVAALIALGSSSVRSEIAGAPGLGSFHSREAMWAVTWKAVLSNMPFGTGAGTFADVYALREDPGAVDVTFINHAHNDYLELLLEFGVPGLILMLGFLGWWGSRVLNVWRSPASSQFARAATIASGAVLAHSLVDFPLRTAAMAAVFAACLAMMAQRAERTRETQARHVRIA